MIAARRYKGRTRTARGERKTQYPTIEIQRPLKVGDLQVDMPDPYPGIDGGHAQGFFLEGNWLGHRQILAVGAFDPHM